MAKKNLEDLLNRLESSVAERREFRNIVNTYEHVYTVDYPSLWKELYTQVSGINVQDKKRVLLLIGQDSALVNELKKHLSTYCSSMFRKFKVSGYELKGTESSFTVNITSSENIDIFEKIIKTQRKRPLKKLQTDVYESINKSDWFKSLLATSKDPKHAERTLEARVLGKQFPTKRVNKQGEVIYGRTSGLFELGHTSGYSVVEKWLNKELGSLGDMLDALPTRAYKESRWLGKLKAAVPINTRNTKKIVFLYDQGALGNKAQSSIENKLIPILTNTIKKTLTSKGADFWADFESSGSINQKIKYSLFSAAKNKNAKIKGTALQKGTKDRETTPAVTKNIRPGTTKITKSRDTLSSGKKQSPLKIESREEQTSNTNWSSLLPLINSRLTAKVIANMRYPGLVNKTGKFATSAEVVSVETTREGFPSFVFNYERDPYDVFDRTKGRPPWSTPERDPRTLVDKSVREVLKEMAIGRFYTRRV